MLTMQYYVQNKIILQKTSDKQQNNINSIKAPKSFNYISTHIDIHNHKNKITCYNQCNPDCYCGNNISNLECQLQSMQHKKQTKNNNKKTHKKTYAIINNLI